METRVIEPMRLSAGWVAMNLKQYKRWFILTALLLGVTTVALPVLLDLEPMAFIVFGLIELFVLSFIMVLVQFRFLHDPKAFAYYQSKALSLKQRVHGIVITQAIYTYSFFLMLLVWHWFSATFLWSRAVFWGSSGLLLDVFVTAGCWIAILLLLSALSAVISGTTAGAAFATVFNFGLPVFLLGIFYFVLSVANAGTIGFNIEAIMGNIVLEHYRLDLIYHANTYVAVKWLILPIELALIYGLLLWVLGKRKSENIGQSFVFIGYKFFVLFAVSMIVPLLFSLWMPNQSFISKWIAILLVSELTFYTVFSIVEKNLVLNAKAIKLLVTFGLFITLLIGGSSVALNRYATHMPTIDEIESVVLSPRDMVMVKPGVRISLFKYNPEWAYEGVPIFYSEGAKESVLTLHETLIQGDLPWVGGGYNIVYYLKDGSKRVFPFSPHLSHDAMEVHHYPRFTEVAKGLMAEDEFWVVASPLLYGVGIDSEVSAKLEIWELGEVKLTAPQLAELVALLRQEYATYKETFDFWTEYPSLGEEMRFGFFKERGLYGGVITGESGRVYYFSVAEHQKDLLEWLEDKFE